MCARFGDATPGFVDKSVRRAEARFRLSKQKK
jgi:hypothetical protein